MDIAGIDGYLLPPPTSRGNFMSRRRLAAWLTTLALASPSLARAIEVQPGIGFIAITGATPGGQIVLSDTKGKELGRAATDEFGSLIIRDLPQGGRFVVSEASGGAGTRVTVLRFADNPPVGFYKKQKLVDGYQYIETRDGTLLAAMVRPPAGKNLSDGPFPTVIEYSGYSPADPDSPQPSTLISQFVGFATVGINMRGSGCSGGVLGLFDLVTTADGYDIVEAVAAQDWVLHGKVGMVGISFPGISQLFVAGDRPPHLAAVAPLSVIADIYRAPGFPGGIFNNGFAQSWLQERKDDAEPAPEGGQGWARKRVNNGDQTCLANQQLRLQTLDPLEFVYSHPFFEPSLMVERSPINWVKQIDVPVFMSSSWQDEQTGGDFASMLNRFPKRPDVKLVVQNGVHSSSLDPDVLWDWLAFLDLYVTKTVPDPGRIGIIAPIIYQQILGPGTQTPPLPSDRFDVITDYDEAKRLFEADPHIRVRMENGAGSPTPGLPAATFDLGFSQWPPTQVHPTVWYLDAGGALSRTRPRGGDSDADTYHPDPSVRPSQTLGGTGTDDSWAVIPAYDWRPLVDGTALAYATPPLTEDVTIVGPGSVDLWLSSSADDTDIQVTLSEIRPDGLEYYVQNGWLRASHRKLDRKTSTRLDPRPTHLEADASPLPFGKPSKVRVGIYAVAHVFRKGSRIRIGIEAPGGDRTRWAFDTFVTGGTTENTIARSKAHPSRLVLPVVPGVEAPQALPTCPGLRGQPCRTYIAATNGG
jgi:predicted acyl esterase